MFIQEWSGARTIGRRIIIYNNTRSIYFYVEYWVKVFDPELKSHNRTIKPVKVNLWSNLSRSKKVGSSFGWEKSKIYEHLRSYELLQIDNTKQDDSSLWSLLFYPIMVRKKISNTTAYFILSFFSIMYNNVLLHLQNKIWWLWND